jgi:hypothetical protein
MHCFAAGAIKQMKIKEAKLMLDGYQKVDGPDVERMQYCRTEYVDIAEELSFNLSWHPRD